MTLAYWERAGVRALKVCYHRRRGVPWLDLSHREDQRQRAKAAFGQGIRWSAEDPVDG
jgi:hypothetical protein